MKTTISAIKGGVTAASGFKAAGEHVGLKRKRKDLAILMSDHPCHYAGTFTTSTAKAAPVLWNKEILEKGSPVRALVVNSGNANSCTGAQGFVHTRQMAEAVAEHTGCQPREVLVASTGIIGVPLPIDDVASGIAMVAPLLGYSKEHGSSAAEAIMTTDSFIKEAALQFEIDGKLITMGAMAKGSGMLHPNMATMLSFITTDLSISPALLQKALSNSVCGTYNMISVDADTSTNDMVAILANGSAGNQTIESENDDYCLFVAALNELNEHLAKSIASDGEGATKLIEVEVKGAATLEDARTLARAVVSSNLVKTAFFASDPNWGRIVAAMGATGIGFDTGVLSIEIAGAGLSSYLLKDGNPCWIEEGKAACILAAPVVKTTVFMGGASPDNQDYHDARAWGCDLTHEYIQLTSRYRSSHVVAIPAKSEVVA